MFINNPTAAIVVIGDEILSGQVLDTNSRDIAIELDKLGINLKEIRAVSDQIDIIANTINQLRHQYTYIFTTGGIGPTHDDLTSEAISLALKTDLIENKDILKIIHNHYNQDDKKLDITKRKMAFIPKGAKLLYNKETDIPSFYIKNIFVFAGIPSIMISMFNEIIPLLKKGIVIKRKMLVTAIKESNIAYKLKMTQIKYQDVIIGSYPFIKKGKIGTSLVLSSYNEEKLKNCYSELKRICKYEV